MTYTNPIPEKAPLGVGAIFSESFSIGFGNLLRILVIAGASSFATIAVEGALYNAPGGTTPRVAEPVAGIALTFFALAFSAISTALLVQLAYDTKRGQPVSIRRCIRQTFPVLHSVVVFQTLVFLMAIPAVVLLIVGSFWVIAVFYVLIPVLVVERAGFLSFSRSAALTKEYRWPIIGLILILFFISNVAEALSTALLLPIAQSAETVAGFLGWGTLFYLPIDLAYSLTGIAIALTYARLREIKEGIAVDDIARVFD